MPERRPLDQARAATPIGPAKNTAPPVLAVARHNVKDPNGGDEVPRRRPGRPSIGDKRKTTLSCRIPKEAKDALKRAAEASGRSLAKEIEIRILQTFAADLHKSAAEIEADGWLAELKPLVTRLLSARRTKVHRRTLAEERR